jgi:hypothetical protein
MWTQVVGFFALDEILAVAVLAFMADWFARTAASRRLSFAVAWLSVISMLIAAVMGHIAGWILSYGAHPWFIPRFAHFVGENVPILLANMTGSHSHDMAVAFMAFVACAGVAQFAEKPAAGPGLIARRTGLVMLGCGVVAFTAAYVAMGFTSWVVPTLFQSAGGTNGLAGDDLLTGIAMLGALIALIGAAAARIGAHALTAVSAAWTTLLSVGLVVATGYWIEFHETFFGAGDAKARGAGSDAVFTWFHQDVGLFLLPLMTASMILTARLVASRLQGTVAVGTMIGSGLLFAVGMVYVFIDSATHGPGYVVATARAARHRCSAARRDLAQSREGRCQWRTPASRRRVCRRVPAHRRAWQCAALGSGIDVGAAAADRHQAGRRPSENDGGLDAQVGPDVDEFARGEHAPPGLTVELLRRHDDGRG